MDYSAARLLKEVAIRAFTSVSDRSSVYLYALGAHCIAAIISFFDREDREDTP